MILRRLLYYLYYIFVLNHWASILLICILFALAATHYIGWGWAFFGAAVSWNLAYTNHNAKRSNHRDYYIFYLLLDDDIRASQKAQFSEWIRTVDAPDAKTLSLRAMAAVERSAETLAMSDPKHPGSQMVSAAMLWQVKHPSSTVEPGGPKGK